jgi:1-deoxy-D-xylulose-5-phosphate synthase
LKAADQLMNVGISATVADARYMKPLDRQLVHDLAREHEVLVTVEEGAVGGFGSHVFQYLAEAGLLNARLKVRAMVLPDAFIDHGHPHQMYELAGLNAVSIAKTALTALGDGLKSQYRVVSTQSAESLRRSL